MPREKILIADDEVYVLKICCRVLQDKYQVKVVSDGFAALQAAQAERFDLFLTDVKMPGLDGLETAQALKQTNPDMVCVTMTGNSTMDIAINALRLGIDEFVIKPFKPTELLDSIERALEKARLRKENIRLRSLLPLFEFNQSLMRTVDTVALTHQILNLATQETLTEQATLCFIDDAGALSFQAHQDMLVTLFEPILRYSQYLVDHLQASNQSQIIISSETPDNHQTALNSLRTILPNHNIIIAPLSSKDRLIGFLALLRNDRQFTQSESSFLKVMISQAEIAYENARLFSDLQQAYDDLKALDHLKDEFINRAAHELRTPLAILMGYTSILEEDITEATHRQFLNIISRNSLRLRTLIEDLLNMQHINTGQLDFTVSKINLKHLIDQLLREMTILATKKQITLESKLPDTLPAIYSDRQKLEVTFLKLIANALKFTPQNGQIWINSRVHEDAVELEIRDTGIGIGVEEQKKIFDSFYQVEPSINRQFEGIGLGLSIAKGMIERCGGRIWVESEEGQGSRFIFAIPVKPVLL